jgi:hypothetical protein
MTTSKSAATGLTNGAVICSRRCTLRYARVIIDPANVPGAPLCAMLFDSNVMPTNGDTPVLRFTVLPQVGDTIIQPPVGEFAPLANGCTVVLSTTFNTLTLAPAGAAYLQGIYDS